MKADIDRITFAPAKNFQHVLLQQGRVQLPADWNEQVAILLKASRTLAADLIGPWGGTPGAFRIDTVDGGREDVTIGAGRYYVDGISCDNTGARYEQQPYYPVPDDRRLDGPDNYLIYLDVWERLVTAAEDDDIREVALGGPDTAARTQAVWQVKARRVTESDMDGMTCQTARERRDELLDLLRTADRGRLRARARIPEGELDRPCAIDPRAGYRHDENTLFRVEVHTPGPAGTATFKWSLDNASVAFPVESFRGQTVRLATLGRDTRSTLQPGDWVELEYDSYVLRGRSEPLLRVTSVDHLDLLVGLDRAPTAVPPGQHPRLRRWDQKGTNRKPLEADGTVKIVEEGADRWIDLGYGVQVQFQPLTTGSGGSPPGSAHRYRPGDFWLIPARTAIGDVLWPREDTPDGPRPAALPPHGVDHHYAPLAWIAVAQDGTVAVRRRFNRRIRELAQCGD